MTLGALALVGAGSAQALEYAQLDVSSNATSAVLVHAVGGTGGGTPAPLVSATYARWDDGASAGIGYVQRWSVGGEQQRWVLGAGVGVNDFRSRVASDPKHDTALSARAQSEWSGPAPAGQYYALLQLSTFRHSGLALLQYSPAALPLSAEISHYEERAYRSTSVGLRIATPASGWFVRVGSTRADGRTSPYLGIAYNGF